MYFYLLRFYCWFVFLWHLNRPRENQLEKKKLYQKHAKNCLQLLRIVNFLFCPTSLYFHYYNTRHKIPLVIKVIHYVFWENPNRMKLIINSLIRCMLPKNIKYVNFNRQDCSIRPTEINRQYSDFSLLLKWEEPRSKK